MKAPETITLGDREFKIAVLPFGVQRALSIGEVQVVTGTAEDAAAREERAWEELEAVFLAAIQPHHPEVTAEDLRALRFTLTEAYAERRKILVLSGLRQAEPSQPGKPQPALNGDGSTAG